MSESFWFGSPKLAVRRGTGRWILVGRIQPEVDGLGRDWTGDFVLPQKPPKALVGHDVLFPPWEVIARKVPDARDAFSSPTKDLLVVLTSDALLTFPIANGTIGKQALRLPLVPGETAVMAQWATGKYIARWNRELRALLKP